MAAAPQQPSNRLPAFQMIPLAQNVDDLQYKWRKNGRQISQCSNSFTWTKCRGILMPLWSIGKSDLRCPLAAFLVQLQRDCKYSKTWRTNKKNASNKTKFGDWQQRKKKKNSPSQSACFFSVSRRRSLSHHRPHDSENIPLANRAHHLSSIRWFDPYSSK